MGANNTTTPRMFLMSYGETAAYRSMDEMERAIRACNPETMFNDLDERDRVMALHGAEFLNEMCEWEELAPTDDPEIWVAERLHHLGGSRYEPETVRYRVYDDGSYEEMDDEE